MIIHKWKHNHKHNSFLPLKPPKSYTLKAQVKFDLMMVLTWKVKGSQELFRCSVRNMNVFTQILCNPSKKIILKCYSQGIADRQRINTLHTLNIRRGDVHWLSAAGGAEWVVSIHPLGNEWNHKYLFRISVIIRFFSRQQNKGLVLNVDRQMAACRCVNIKDKFRMWMCYMQL